MSWCQPEMRTPFCDDPKCGQCMTHRVSRIRCLKDGCKGEVFPKGDFVDAETGDRLQIQQCSKCKNIELI